MPKIALTVRVRPRWAQQQKEDFSMRPPAALSGPMLHRLNAYALAATAAGVSALALASPARAEIVYTPADVVIAPGDSYILTISPNQHRGNFSFVNEAGTQRGHTQNCYDQKGH